ncbi:MAG: hypothetical protein ABWX83_08995, partial [Luteibacter sp.]
MRIPTLARRSLTLALTAALVAPSCAMAAETTGAPLAIVAFSDPASQSFETSIALGLSAPIISPNDAHMLDGE